MITRNLDGDIFTIRLGLPGEGKTLAQTEQDVLPLLTAGLEVYCNYWINWEGPNFHLFTDMEEIIYLRNCVVVIDEIATLMDPRDYSSESKALRIFFQQHRHRAVDIVANTQHLSLIPKTALIEVKTFLHCTKSWSGWLLKSFFPGFPWIVVREEELTPVDLKKMENGSYRVQDENGDDEDEDFTEYSVKNSETFWFNKKALYHRELNDFKIELVHRFCPKCKARQGEQILKDKTYDFAIFDIRKDKYVLLEGVDLGFCPKHKTQPLEIRESGLYDTRYEVVPNVPEVVFRPFFKTLKEAPYRGVLTEEQLSQKRQLESQ